MRVEGSRNLSEKELSEAGVELREKGSNSGNYKVLLLFQRNSLKGNERLLWLLLHLRAQLNIEIIPMRTVRAEFSAQWGRSIAYESIK